MSSPTQGICNDILFPLDVMNMKIILTKELHPPSLPSIKVWLSKYVLQALVVGMKFESMT